MFSYGPNETIIYLSEDNKTILINRYGRKQTIFSDYKNGGCKILCPKYLSPPDLLFLVDRIHKNNDHIVLNPKSFYHYLITEKPFQETPQNIYEHMGIKNPQNFKTTNEEEKTKTILEMKKDFIFIIDKSKNNKELIDVLYQELSYYLDLSLLLSPFKVVVYWYSKIPEPIKEKFNNIYANQCEKIQYLRKHFPAVQRLYFMITLPKFFPGSEILNDIPKDVINEYPLFSDDFKNFVTR